MLGAPIRHRSANTGRWGQHGLRRIDWVRVDLTGDQPRADAHGVRHRLPRSVAISIEDALRLARAGVPLVVRRPGGEG
ncbi:MAG TPA: hypothetical protein VK866_18285 [Acidimicrobiales bacterium]|nr:hypothetical protein [Acidimicrobiales bacterium]